jgi:hypothetical protein
MPPTVLFVPPGLEAEAQQATPPPRIRSGFFQPLIGPTRHLLDRGFSLPEAAEWFMARGILDVELGRRFVPLMRPCLARFRQRKTIKAQPLAWKRAGEYVRRHVVGTGTEAICGAPSSQWTEAGCAEMPDCMVCRGRVQREGLLVPLRNDAPFRAPRESRAVLPGDR